MSEKQKVTWNDLHNATSAELKKTYKLTDRQLEQQVSSHVQDASKQERRKIYETTYAKRR